ncbi:hypothetical protein ACUXST_001687 [Sphingomonas sp. F9_3S_D5_B_2]
MGMMNHDSLSEEADNCRRRALAYLGHPEATFLLSAARTFEELAEAERRIQVRPPRDYA